MHRSFVIGFAVIAALAALPAQAQTALRWKFAADQSYTITSVQQTEVETSINNKPRRAYLEMSLDLEWHVDKVEEDVATITQTITRLALKTTAPEADPIVYDSGSPTKPTGAAKAMAAGVAPLVGASFVLKVEPSGDITQVTLSEKAQEAIAALPAENQLKEALSVEGLARLFQAGGALPKKPVQPGDTWPIATTTKTPYGALSHEGTWTYVGPHNAQGIELQKLELASQAKLEPATDAPLKLRLTEQSKTGALLFNAEAGHPVSLETQLVSRSVRPFREQQIHVKITATSKLEIAPK